MDYNQLVREVRKKRKEKKIKQCRIAQQLEISSYTYNNFERMRNTINSKTLLKLFNILKIGLHHED